MVYWAVMTTPIVMTTPSDITRFIDDWLLERRGQISDLTVDFALDVRNLVLQLEEVEIREPVRV